MLNNDTPPVHQGREGRGMFLPGRTLQGSTTQQTPTLAVQQACYSRHWDDRVKSKTLCLVLRLPGWSSALIRTSSHEGWEEGTGPQSRKQLTRRSEDWGTTHVARTGHTRRTEQGDRMGDLWSSKEGKDRAESAPP